jgi:hypothetical protein
MNKTILLACCDFLILATLSLNYKSDVHKNSSPRQEIPYSDDFELKPEEEKDQDLLTTAIYERKIAILLEGQQESEYKLTQKKEELQDLSKQFSSLQKSYSTLLQKHKLNSGDRIHQIIDQARLQVTISMTEDDSLTPDFYTNTFYSCCFNFNGKNYLLADFKDLGLSWPELINDGHINRVSMIMAKANENPWSSQFNSAIQSLNQAPSLCIVEVSSKYEMTQLELANKADTLNKLDKLYAAKSNGRVIKIQQAAILPHKRNSIEISEERFLGQPDKLATGDLVITETGKLIGMIGKTSIDGNSLRHNVIQLSQIDLKNRTSIPLGKINQQGYFSDFVNKAKQVFTKIKP